MTEHSRSPAFNRRKLIWVFLVFLVAGYIYFQPQLEQWLGVKLPTLDDRPVTRVEKSSSKSPTRDDTRKKSSGESREYPSLSQQPEASDKAWWTARDPVHPSGFQFQQTSKKGYFTSPAGLQYRLYDPRDPAWRTSPDSSRVEHILRHAEDDPTRPVHGVFEGDDRRILETVDEAYRLVNSNNLSPANDTAPDRVQTEKDDDKPFRTVYHVDMRRTIGFEGGRRGRERGHPQLSHITLVLDGPDSRIITAYPSR